MCKQEKLEKKKAKHAKKMKKKKKKIGMIHKEAEEKRALVEAKHLIVFLLEKWEMFKWYLFDAVTDIVKNNFFSLFVQLFNSIE